MISAAFGRLPESRAFLRGVSASASQPTTWSTSALHQGLMPLPMARGGNSLPLRFSTREQERAHVRLRPGSGKPAPLQSQPVWRSSLPRGNDLKP